MLGSVTIGVLPGLEVIHPRHMSMQSVPDAESGSGVDALGTSAAAHSGHYRQVALEPASGATCYPDCSPSPTSPSVTPDGCGHPSNPAWVHQHCTLLPNSPDLGSAAGVAGYGQLRLLLVPMIIAGSRCRVELGGRHGSGGFAGVRR
jgi:hypothetical protein